LLHSADRSLSNLSHTCVFPVYLPYLSVCLILILRPLLYVSHYLASIQSNSNGLFSNFLFLMSRGLACCINPQPGGAGDFFYQGFLPLVLDTPVSNCKSAVLALVRPRYFISPVPPQYLLSIHLSAPGGGAQWKTSNCQMGAGRCGNIVKPYLLTYLLTYSLHGAESLLRS